MIELESVSRFFEGEGAVRIEALRDVSLRIDPGELVCVTGPSGAGKSTLMNILGCLDRPSSGSYRFAGREVSKLGPDILAWLRRQAFGFVFQNCNLLDSATALENVELPGRYAGLTRGLRRKRARELLWKLRLKDRAGHLPAELSGGEQQRVAIARALMNGGRVLLADEPTGALDRDNGEEVLSALEQLAAQGHTVVIISHNPDIAARAHRRIELLDGRVVSDSGPLSTGAQLPGDAPAVRGKGLKALPGALEAVRAGWAAFRAGLRRGARLRTALTVLSVLVAVWLGAMLLSIGEGVYRDTAKWVNRMGLDTIGVSSMYAVPTLGDAKAIKEQAPNVRAVSPMIWQDVMVRRDDISAETRAYGFVDLGQKEGRGPGGDRMETGDFITQQEDDNLEQVAVLGSIARERLFPNAMNPLGQQILIENLPFRVKGVLKFKDSRHIEPSREWQLRVIEGANNVIHVPFKTLSSVLGSSSETNWIYVFVQDPDRIFGTASAIRDIGFRRHGTEAFFVTHPAESIEKAKRFRRQLWFFLGAIAGVALLAGNLSVMTTMLMSVRARRREIGIRIAVGARQRDILRQFLSEAMVVSFAGGLLGALAGLASVPALRLLGIPVEPLPWFFAVPFACVLVVSALFGIAPARRAARLDPVAALGAD